MKAPRWLLITSLILNLVGGCYLLFGLYKSAEQNSELSRAKEGQYFYMQRDALFALLPKDSNEIVFTGDSHIEYFNATEFYKNCLIKNRGIESDVTGGVLYRLIEVVKSKPVKIFIEAGTNDVMRGYTQDTIMYNFKYMMDYIKYESPASKIYVMSIVPNAGFVRRSNDATMPITLELNRRLITLCQQEYVQYIDFTSLLLKEDHIIEKYYIYDLQHLSPKGYVLLKNVLQKYVNE